MPVPPNPPRMSQKMGNRPGFMPPKPSPAVQVETEKFDPASLARSAPPPAPPPAARRSEQDILANAEPIKASAPPPPTVPTPEPPPVAPPPAKDPLEATVSDDLIASLEAKFGIQPEKLHDVTLTVQGQTLNATVRLPAYDDFIWAMAVIQRKVENQEDASLLQTDAQRNNMMQHMVNCRAIVKLEGQWLWQVFKQEANIRTALPTWDGQSWEAIPDFIRGSMAMQVYNLFRHRLHADMMFELEAVIKRAEASLRPTPPVPTDEESKADPSSAS